MTQYTIETILPQVNYSREKDLAVSVALQISDFSGSE